MITTSGFLPDEKREVQVKTELTGRRKSVRERTNPAK